ncbi:MAG: hypothetical protein SOU94_02750 [Acidaminococcus sp.]|uniref:Uncharacterized protein n=1 Tax=Acidaminococcus intestini TaxID=187327 RepID=A0A943EK20_9FIRM|nr:hypothetical protein [Acidaminococcus sp.]MBS5519404.1 hypothetical protein [Acidaminococcus intestini]MDY2738732.1 hypothetical protein [Acidaminococcus sp.]
MDGRSFQGVGALGKQFFHCGNTVGRTEIYACGECVSHRGFFQVSGAVLVEAGSTRLY